MYILARLQTLDDAYRGMELLRSHAIPPALAQDGEELVISVDEDYVEVARTIFGSHSIDCVGDQTLQNHGIQGITNSFEDSNS